MEPTPALSWIPWTDVAQRLPEVPLSGPLPRPLQDRVDKKPVFLLMCISLVSQFSMSPGSDSSWCKE